MIKQIIPRTAIRASIQLPGSKYIANRLIPLCALASSPSKLSNVVDNNDINAAIEGLSRLGYVLERHQTQLLVSPKVNAEEPVVAINTGHSGTFSRFVAAITALENSPVKIDCSAKMATRPMAEIFAALRSMGVSIDSPNDCLPATITGPIQGEHCLLDASRSSQYLSALLIIAPMLANGLEIELQGEVVSKAYVEMTIQLMAKMGVKVEQRKNGYRVAGGQAYKGLEMTIPPDPVSSTYFMAAAAISGGEVTIENFDFDSLQGEAQFYQVLEQMGVMVARQEKDLIIKAGSELNAIEVDMGDMPDAVQTLAVIACFAKGTTRITNIAHLAFKESDRIRDTAKELAKTGIQVEAGDDYLLIHGGVPKGAIIETHDDHRMAMSMALLGIRTAGIQINQAQVVEKSFPRYWQLLAEIGVNSQSVE